MLIGTFKHQTPHFELDLDFKISGNGITALFGRSGSGKSSLLRLVAGLDRAKTGSLTFQGEEWQSDQKNIFVPTHLRRVGYVPQDAFLFPHLDVRENLNFGFSRVKPSDRVFAMDEIINQLDIESLLHRKTDRLSGGEKQRVCIARALLTSPKLLLLDEPLSALDSFAKSELIPALIQIKSSLKIPMIYVSHDWTEIKTLADQVLTLRSGRIIEQLSEPANLETRFHSSDSF